MASSILVADYGSSDSENEEENPFEKTKLEKKCSELPAGVNLLASTGDKSDSDTDSDTTKGPDKNSPASSKQRAKTDDGSGLEKLPLPSVLGMGSAGIQHGESGTSSLVPTSIFANPFEEAEQHKLSILEQHVKLTSAQRKEAELGGKKKICWKFRNGRCRFGHKCKFAHDSDVPSTLAACSQEELPVDGTADDRVGYQEYIGGGFNQGAWPEQGGGDGDGEEEGEGQLKRKRRPGLSQTLVPSKKVMTAYSRQRNHESPWSQHR